MTLQISISSVSLILHDRLEVETWLRRIRSLRRLHVRFSQMKAQRRETPPFKQRLRIVPKRRCLARGGKHPSSL